jgi:hypothetical protein
MIYNLNGGKVRHGNVTDGIDDLMNNERVQIVYSDPPWGLGNLRYWQTINKRMTGAEPREVNYENFIYKIFEISTRYSEKYYLLEYGIKWRKDIKDMAKQFNWIDNGTINLKYRSGSVFLDLDLHIFSKTNIQLPENYVQNCTNTYGLNTLKNAILPLVKSGDKILDPCCGMGYTAQIAIDNNLYFYGNELNMKRLQKTINRFK